MIKVDVSHELLSKVKGRVGWIVLNRPKALNALSLQMVRDLANLLKAWQWDPSINAIVIKSAGEKAFCAGGDVRAVYEAEKRGDFTLCDAFFREEYTLNAQIYSYPKPYISLIDGLAMGGGLGLSINGSHRIVTEQALLAMPETNIGFFPDVGATTFLTQKYPIVGLYLALTGISLKATDALWFGLATHYISSTHLSSLKADLDTGKEVGNILSHYAQIPQEEGFLESHQKAIENHFNKSSLQEIFESLADDPSPFTQNTLNTLKTKSPTSLAVTFRQLKQQPSPLSFIEKMKQEFRISQRIVKSHDFKEGIRAVLVDKDRLPRWNPSAIEDLLPEDIEHFFAPLGERELVLNGTPALEEDSIFL